MFLIDAVGEKDVVGQAGGIFFHYLPILLPGGEVVGLHLPFKDDLADDGILRHLLDIIGQLQLLRIVPFSVGEGLGPDIHALGRVIREVVASIHLLKGVEQIGQIFPGGELPAIHRHGDFGGGAAGDQRHRYQHKRGQGPAQHAFKFGHRFHFLPKAVKDNALTFCFMHFVGTNDSTIIHGKARFVHCHLL